MAEQQLSGGGVDSDSGPVCPWCSAALPSDSEERCPSCGAALHEAAEATTSEVPGVTRIDHEALLKGRPTTSQKSRGIIGWLSGEYEAADTDAAPPGTLEPPDEAVRREMLRLELAALEAEVLARQAEAAAEVATETGQPVDLENLGLAEADTDAAAVAESTDAESADAESADAESPDAESPDEATEESRGA